MKIAQPLRRRAQALPRPRASVPGGWARRLLRDRRGSTAVEFALTLPALVVLLIGVMEMGRILWLQNALNHAVSQSARCASIDANNCATAAQVAAYAARISGATFTNSTFALSTPACGNQVSASFPVQLYIPFLGQRLTLTALSCFPK